MKLAKTFSRREMKNPYVAIADKPVVTGLEHHEVKVTGQRTLSANTADGRVLIRYSLTPEQRVAIAQGADLFVMQLTFHRPVMPMQLTVQLGEMSRDIIYRDFQLYKCRFCDKTEIGDIHDANCPMRDKKDEQAAVPTTVIATNYDSIESRLIALMMQRGMISLLDKFLNRLTLSETEQAQLNDLNTEVACAPQPVTGSR